MATGTVFLDVDDEITSAAARIRESEATKVALVVPYGSRISTSRMNFRLLSREAVVNNRRLSIVASDPATRALAASAGLPVFTSVGEYEAALAAPAAQTDVPPAASADPGGGGPAGGPAAPATKARRSKKSGSATETRALDETQVVALPPIAASAGAASGMAATAPADLGHAPARIPVIKSRRMPKIGTPVLVAAVAIALLAAVAGVGAFVFLPSAAISITPKETPIGPIPLVIRADPDAQAVDAADATVPAVLLEIPVEVTDTFPATGVRVEREAAAGSVTFQSFNFLNTNHIPAGSIVSTEGGIEFRTARGFTLAKAQLVLPNGNVIPSSGTVAVTAVESGTSGNVPANAIRVVPPGENPEFTTVNNTEPTRGGRREEFKLVSQADVDAAFAALQPRLNDAFAAAVDSGAGAPLNAQVFEQTAALGAAVPSADPATLIGTEVDTFEFGLAASGTVIAVDDSPVRQIAISKVRGNVEPGHRLVDDSIVIDRGEPTVVDGFVTFPLSVRGTQIEVLDRDTLLALIKGKSIADARTALAPFGDVEITPWPDWVSSIPGMDSRVTLEIVGQDAPAGGPGSGASASPGASESSTGSSAP